MAMANALAAALSISFVLDAMTFTNLREKNVSAEDALSICWVLCRDILTLVF